MSYDSIGLDEADRIMDDEEKKQDHNFESESFMIRDLDNGISYDVRVPDVIEEVNIFSISSVVQPTLTEINSDTQQGNASTNKPTQQTSTNSKAWSDYWRKIKKIQENFFDFVQMGDLPQLKNLLETPNIPFSYDIKWHDEWTPLHYASNEGHADIVEFLLNKGADVKAKTSFDYSVLHVGCLRGSVECVRIILSKDTSFINDQDKDFNTALHYACKYGYEKIVKLLLSCDADITIQNHIGNVPSQEVQLIEILQLFQEHSKQKGIDLSQSQKDFYNNRTVWKNSIMKNSRQDHVQKFLKLAQNADRRSFWSQQNNNEKTTEQQLLQQVQLPNSAKLKKRPLNPLFFRKISLGGGDESTQENTIAISVGPNDFEVIETLGKGAFGHVYLVSKKDDGQQYAMKVLQKERILGKKILKYALTERNVLSVMQHPFIVSLKYAFQTKNKLYLVMDYCPGGDLDNLLLKKGRVNEEIAKIYICEIILAMEALHQNNIVFRDLKPSNVVLDKDGHACVTDFGLAKQGIQHGDITKSFCGSLAYLPPEMLNKTGHTMSLDWYLLGVLFYELLEGMPPFYSDNKQKLFENIRHAQLKMPKNASENAKSLLKGLLNKDPMTRLGSRRGGEEIKEHPYFSNVNWEDVYNKKLMPPVPKRGNPQNNPIMEGQQNQIRVTISQDAQIKEPVSKEEGVESNYVDSWDFAIKKKQPQSSIFNKN